MTRHQRVQDSAEGLLDAVAGHDRIDLIATLGYPLLLTVIAEMLGVQAKDMGRFEHWSDDMALIVEPIPTPAPVQSVRRATEELLANFEPARHSRLRWRVAGGAGGAYRLVGVARSFPVDPPSGRAPVEGPYRPSWRREPLDRSQARAPARRNLTPVALKRIGWRGTRAQPVRPDVHGVAELLPP